MNFSICKGATLLEVIIVVTIIAVFAVVALPSFTSSEKYQRESVAQQFADAIRFARTESIRTGQPHGFRFLSAQDRIRIFSADTTINPAGLVWDVYHPIDKQLYDYTLPPEAANATNPIQRVAIYRGTCNTPGIVYFNANGMAWCNDPNNILVDYFDLEINVGSGQSIVHLDGITGRVTIQ